MGANNLPANSTGARARPRLGPAQARLRPGDRVATPCWNHHAHLECYFGIPAAGGVMHTLNLRLAPEEIGWIAGDAHDRFLVVDDVLLPLYRNVARRARVREGDSCSRSSGAAVAAEFDDYDQAARERRSRAFRIRGRTTRTTRWPLLHLGHHGRPKASCIRTAQPCCTRSRPAWCDFWGLRGTDSRAARHAPCSTPTVGLSRTGHVMMVRELGVPRARTCTPRDLLDHDPVRSRPTLSLACPRTGLTLIQASTTPPGYGLANTAAGSCRRHALAGGGRGPCRRR